MRLAELKRCGLWCTSTGLAHRIYGAMQFVVAVSCPAACGGDAEDPAEDAAMGAGGASASVTSSVSATGSGASSPGTRVIEFADGPKKIRHVAVTASNDLLLTGASEGFSWAGRTTIAGETLWSIEAPSTLSSSANHFTAAVARADDGGAFLVGQIVHPDTGSSEATILSVDGVGTTIWSHTLTFDLSGSTLLSPIVDDDTLLLPADRFGIVRLTTSGDFVSWLTPKEFEFSVSVAISNPDRTILLAGGTQFLAAGRYSLAPWIAMLDAQDSLVWQRRLIDRHGNVEAASSFPDGGTLVVGTLYDTTSSDTQGFVARIATDGAVAWWRTVSSPSGKVGFLGAAVLETDGVLAVGYSGDSPQESLVVRLSASGGALESANRLAHIGSYARSFGVTSFGSQPVIVGEANQSGLLMFTDENGAVGGCTYPFVSGASGVTVEAEEPQGFVTSFDFDDGGLPTTYPAPVFAPSRPGTAAAVCSANQ